ncbi:MAG: hypothetical protein WC144_03205 [Sulfurimonas sp.]|jgi:cell division protein FtsB|nr:hypothetical protein [Sulfurimonadaceae bacterium]
MREKTNLLDEIDSIVNPKKDLDVNFLLYVVFLMLLVLSMLFPKIYISQQIHFTSRDIAKLKGEYDTLKEENQNIKTSLESLRYKNQVLDTTF